jgi:hypothetical protein
MAPSLLLSAAIAAVYLIWEPPSADLAAQTFRVDLFADQGFTVWSTAWYGGFHVPGYSPLYPPLASWLGLRIVGALAAVAAAGLFAALASRRFGARAPIGSLWFAAGVSAWLFTGRMPFLLGVAIGLAALLAADSRRLWAAAVLALLTALASPVAGFFLLLGGVTLGLVGDRARAASLALPPAAAIVFLALAFPTGGEEPFVFSSFVAVPLLAIAALWQFPPEQRELRIAVVVYLLVATVAFVVPNPLGGNVVRLGALFAGPVIALTVWSRPAILVLLVVPAIYWQLSAPVRDTIVAVGDPSTEEGFYAPLLAELQREVPPSSSPQGLRVEVPPTHNRWESVYVAERFPLARGWLRQLESEDFDLFEDGNLTPEAYREWLGQHGVSFVAVPLDVERDHLADDEVKLVDGGLPYLEPVWESADWRLYRVAGKPDLRYRWTPYWEVVAGDGCVERDGDWTLVEPDHGELEVAARFNVDGLLGRDRVCSG